MKQSIAYNIRMLRENKNLTPNQLSEQIGVSLATVYNWEQGKTLPSSESLPLLASILDTTIDNIMLFENHEQKTPFSVNYYLSSPTFS